MKLFQNTSLRRGPSLATHRKRRSSALYVERLEDRALLAAPTAMADVYLLDQDSYLSEPAPGVLANDWDDDGDALEVIQISGPAHGTLTLNLDGSFDYWPEAGFSGTDAFTYLATDGIENSEVVAVTLTVNLTNHTPIAADDEFFVDEDNTLVVDAPGVLTNDYDPEGASLTAWGYEGPYYGTLALETDGSLVYVPSPEFSGTDTFAYWVNDGNLDSFAATVTITVNPVNDVPFAYDDWLALTQDGSIAEGDPSVLSNDYDTEGDALSAALVDAPANGTVELNSDGTFVYLPNADFLGDDSFTYLVHDGTSEGNVATVWLSISAKETGEGPVAADDAFSLNQNDVLSVGAPGLLENDTDPEGQPLAALIYEMTQNGSLLFNVDGSFVYTPAQDFTGTDTFSYYVSDGVHSSGLATVTLTVNPLNDDALFVQELYRDVLGRAPEPEGMRAWQAFLGAGNSRTVVARAFWNSDEHRGHQIDEWYVTFLGRPADPAGRAGWVAAMQGGLDELDVISRFLTSPEYLGRKSENEAFVSDLYLDLLGREADSLGLAAWTQALKVGKGRDSVALGFLNSNEGLGHLVDTLYFQFLDRNAGQAEQDAWAALLQADRVTLGDVAVLILSSPEFYVKA